MNIKLSRILTLAFVALTVTGNVWAQRSNRNNDKQAAALIQRVETHTIAFRNSLAQNRRGNAVRRDELDRHFREFEDSTYRLRQSYNQRRDVRDDVSQLLTHAGYIDALVRQYRVNGTVKNSWNNLRADLDRLAAHYNIAWQWNAPGAPPTDENTASRLDGTFSLNRASSEDVALMAERETRSVRASDRQRARDEITRRLVTPNQLALMRNNNEITIASSLAPQMTLLANGRTNTERTPNGRAVNVSATLDGDRLTVNYAGETDSYYKVVFTPQDQGRSLQVTRRVYINALRRYLEVNSYYDRTSNIAQFDLYRSGAGDNQTYPEGRASNDFVIPNNTMLVAALQNNLATGSVKEGERFTAIVSSPTQYNGAVIEGYVSNVERSGRVSGRAKLTLNFDQIRLRNSNTTYRFAATLESVRMANGDAAQIDTEGTVRDSSQTNKTVTRAGIGAGIGAIIGAIAGGGKGAAIGAVVGGGAGAGSVLAQGRDDLTLASGTEFTLRASAPANTTAVR